MAFDELWRMHTALGLVVAVDVPPRESWQGDVITEAMGMLHPDEAAFAGTLPAHRQRTWIGGRVALQHAMGLGDRPVLANQRGAPHVPAPWRASISHKESIAVALASNTCASNVHLGIDVELLHARPRMQIASHVLTDAEQTAWHALPDDAARWRSLITIFALKEALYKAIDPWVQRYVGFREVTIVSLETGAAVHAQAIPDQGAAQALLHFSHPAGPFDIILDWRMVQDGVIACAQIMQSSGGR